MSTFEFMMHYFSPAPRHRKFHYDETNYKCIDANSIISNVTIEFDPFEKIYSLDLVDAKSLDEFVGRP